MKNLKKNIRYYFLILLSVFIQNALCAQQTDIIEIQSTIQPPEWLFYNYENTSLPDWPFPHVLVDHYDNIWAGTRGGGLVKYDGAVWTVYNKENSWLPNDSISAMAMDHYGNIWIGTGGGLAKVNGSNWEVYTNDNSEIPEGIITSIAFDNNNDIWLSTAYYLDEEEYSWFGCEESKLVKVEGLSVSDDPVWTFYDNTELASYFVSEMAFDATGNLWLSYSKGTLVKFDGSQFTEYDIFSLSGGIGNKFSFTIDQDNIIWTGDLVGRLVKFDGTNAEFIEPGFPDAGQPRFDWEKFWSLAVDENNNLWLGTQVGFIKYNGSSWTYYKLEAQISSLDFSSDGVLWAGSYHVLYAFEEGVSLNWYWRSNTGLPINDVTAVKCDGSDNSWIGSYGGVSRFDGVSWKVFNENNSGLPDNHITAIEEDGEKNMWIGTTKGLAVKQAISLPGQEWIVYTPYNSALPGLSIRCLHYGNGNLWVGTSLGLTRFDGENWETFNSDNSMLPDDGVRAITTDNDGNIWVGTYNSGLCKIPALLLNDPNWEIYNTDNSALPDNGVRALQADSSGYMWIGTRGGGLAGFDGEEFTIYNTGNSDLPGNYVISLRMDKDNKLWIGTLYEGVAKFDGTDWTLFNCENSDMPMGAVWSLDMDQYGNMWFGIDGGGVAVYNEAGIASRNNLVLSGQLFLDGGDTPLEESVVELYRMDSTEYAEQLILSGTNDYAFTGQEYGQYTIKVIPDTLSYPETLPTWLGYKLARVYASYITLSSNITGRDITVVQRPPAGSGTGTVTGTLFESNIAKSGLAIVSKDEKNGTVIKDCYVYLLDPGDRTVKAFDITSHEGEFVFSNLDQGNYMFYTDYNEIPMDVSNPLLEISSTNDTLVISALAGEYVIGIAVDVSTGIETLLQRNLKVYPVPVRDQMIIDFENNIADMNIQNISIVDLSGKVVYNRNLTVWSGSQIVIDMNRFMPGVYLLKIQGKDACYFVKLIKM